MRQALAFITAVLISLGLHSPATSAAETMLRVEVGKSTLMRLAREPAIVVVGDPLIADVVVESPRLIFLLGLEPGETNVYVMDGEGKTLLSRSIVVVPADSRHVTVTRGIEDVTLSCSPRCVTVPNPAGTGEGQVGAGTTQAGGADAGGQAAENGEGTEKDDEEKTDKLLKSLEKLTETLDPSKKKKNSENR